MEVKVKLQFVNRGIANVFPDGTIEIHKDLEKYPDLFYPILEHELEHSNSGYHMKDFMIDLFPIPKLSSWKLFKFMIKRPSTWWQLLPLYYDSSRGIVFDIGHILIYLFYFGTAAVVGLVGYLVMVS